MSVHRVSRVRTFKEPKKSAPYAFLRHHTTPATRIFYPDFNLWKTGGLTAQDAQKLKGALAQGMKKTPHLVKGLLGAAGGYGAYRLLTGPIKRKLNEKIDLESGEIAKNKKPIIISRDRHGKELLKAVRRFKKEHPQVKDVPVYASGKVPASVYVPELAFQSPEEERVLNSMNIKKPGVYLSELSAPAALHELGHAALDEKVPGISLMTHFTSALALPLLAYVALKKPGKGAGFIQKYSPAIAASLQVPMLAEEAAASIMAEKSLRVRGETGKQVLLPAWMSHAVKSMSIPAAVLAAKYLKRI